MSQDSDGSLLFSDDLTDEELEQMLSELAADEDMDKENLILDEDDTATSIKDEPFDTASLEDDFDFGLEVDTTEKIQTEVNTDSGNDNPKIINDAINKQPNASLGIVDKPDTLSDATDADLSSNIDEFDFELDDALITSDDISDTNTASVDINDISSDNQDNNQYDNQTQTIHQEAPETTDLNIADFDFSIGNNATERSSDDISETISDSNIDEESSSNEDSLDGILDADVLTEDNTSMPSLEDITLENEKATSTDEVDHTKDADLSVDFLAEPKAVSEPKVIPEPDIMFEPSIAMQSETPKVVKPLMPIIESVIEETFIDSVQKADTVQEAPSQDMSHLMSQQAHGLAANHTTNNEVTDIEVDALGHIKHQTRLLKSYLSDIEAPFLAANQVSSQLIREVRQLQNEQHGQYADTHVQTHELRTKLINARKQFIELLSIVDLAEESLESEYSDQIHRSD